MSSNMKNRSIVNEKWKQKLMKIHRMKVKDAKLKPTLNFKMANIALNNNKTTLLREERYTEIERENRILLEKMTKIMTEASVSQNLVVNQSINLKRPNVTPSMIKVPVKSITKSMLKDNSSVEAKIPRKQTRNNVKKNREDERIKRENALMLSRLQSKRPIYNVDNWINDFKLHKNRVKDIAKYYSKQSKVSMTPAIIEEKIAERRFRSVDVMSKRNKQSESRKTKLKSKVDHRPISQINIMDNILEATLVLNDNNDKIIFEQQKLPPITADFKRNRLKSESIRKQSKNLHDLNQSQDKQILNENKTPKFAEIVKRPEHIQIKKMQSPELKTRGTSKTNPQIGRNNNKTQVLSSDSEASKKASKHKQLQPVYTKSDLKNLYLSASLCPYLPSPAPCSSTPSSVYLCAQISI